MEIRPYKNKDYYDVREICTETATGVFKEKPYIARLLFCDYYITHEPENCFVAVDENNKAVGYIICTTNPKKHRKYTLNALLSIKENEKALYFQQKTALTFEEILNVGYPAHLHIDIKEEYQRMGLGKQLMDALIDHLKKKEVRGVHLGVGSTNEKGNNFYKKYGFKKLLAFSWCTIYGMKLKK